MIYATTGRPSEGMTLHRRLRNATQWISIAQFLAKDPLLALGLEGGWDRGVGGQPEVLACDGPKAGPGPELVTPPSNTGVNKAGGLTGVEQTGCSRCVVISNGVIVLDRCEACK